jgi:hypothetical protein
MRVFGWLLPTADVQQRATQSEQLRRWHGISPFSESMLTTDAQHETPETAPICAICGHAAAQVQPDRDVPLTCQMCDFQKWRQTWDAEVALLPSPP